MSYQASSYSDLDDLFGKFDTFITGTPGWTQDEFDATTNDRAGWHAPAGTLYVHTQWDEASGQAQFYQSTAHVAATQPWAHTNDSGSGAATTTPGSWTSSRGLNVVGGGGNYWFFEDDTYVHCVLEPTAGVYRHFGFGILDKIGDWTGGEYVYGHYWAQAASDIDYPTDTSHTFGLGGFQLSQTTNCATMRASGLSIAAATTGMWGAFYHSTLDAKPGSDRGGTPRCAVVGGWQINPFKQMVRYRYSSLNQHKPLVPIPVWMYNGESNPEEWMLLGYQKDVRLVNMWGINPEEEISDGVDTWTVFPLVSKKFTLDDTEQSWNAGIAYKKVTT